MYKSFKSGEKRNLIRWVMLNSVLVQITFLAFPLTIYMIYNKVLSYNNVHSIWFFAVFLIVISLIQLVLKNYEALQRNLLKLDHEMGEQKLNIENKLNNENNSKKHGFGIDLAQDIIASISNITTDTNHLIQGYLTKTYLGCLIIYFALILMIGKILVIVPLIFFSVNMIIAYFINNKYQQNLNDFNLVNAKECVYVKEILNKQKVLKSLSVEDNVTRNAQKLFHDVNIKKSLLVYYKGLLQKINMVFNITNIAFILLVGRYFYNIGLMNTEAIITCSLLTIWVARPFYHILFNLNYMSRPLQAQKSILNSKSNVNSPEESRADDIDYGALYDNELLDLKENGCAYYDNDEVKKFLLSMTSNEYKKTSYVNYEIGLFYGSVIDNLTIFDNELEEKAKELVSLFGVENLIYNLPYLYNYVITGSNDQVVPFDLLITIAIIRELLSNPELIVIEIDVNRVNSNVISGLIRYCKKNDIKLIIKKSKDNIKDIVFKSFNTYEDKIIFE